MAYVEGGRELQISLIRFRFFFLETNKARLFVFDPKSQVSILSLRTDSWSITLLIFDFCRFFDICGNCFIYILIWIISYMSLGWSWILKGLLIAFVDLCIHHLYRFMEDGNYIFFIPSTFVLTRDVLQYYISIVKVLIVSEFE